MAPPTTEKTEKAKTDESEGELRQRRTNARVLKTKIPESWRLEWLRFKQPSVPDNQEFAMFLTFLKREINMREDSAATERTSARGAHQPATTEPHWQRSWDYRL